MPSEEIVTSPLTDRSLQGDRTELFQVLFSRDPSSVEAAMKVSSDKEDELSLYDITILLEKIAENNAKVLMALLNIPSSSKELQDFVLRLQKLKKMQKVKIEDEQTPKEKMRAAEKLVSRFFSDLFESVDNSQSLCRIGVEFYKNIKIYEYEKDKLHVLGEKDADALRKSIVENEDKAQMLLQSLKEKHREKAMVLDFIKRLREFAWIERENRENAPVAKEWVTVEWSMNNTSEDMQSRYNALLQKYPSWPDREKLHKIKITSDGKVEMMDMGKKFSLLTAEHNGKDVFIWTHTDQYGNQWISWVAYLTGKAAERVCQEQGKKLFENKEEAQAFMSCFPGENEKARVMNFVTLMWLEKAGCWNPGHKRWINVGSYGYAALSKVNEDGNVYEACWSDGYAGMTWDNQGFPQPVVASEDC